MTSHHNQGDKWLSAENKTASILKWCPEYSNNSFAIPKGKGSRKTLEQLMLPERKDENTFETFPKDPLVTRSVDEKLSKIEEEEDGVCLPEKPKRMLVVWLPKVSMLAQHCQVPGHSFYKETGKNIKSLDRNEREELTALPCIRYHHRSPVHFMEGFVRKPAKFADQPEKGEPQSRATTSEDNLPRVSTRQVCSTQKEHANKNFLHSKPTCSNSLVESLKKQLIERPVENALQKELAKRAKNKFDPARLVRTNDSQVTHITLNNSIMEPTVSQAISLQYDHYTWSPLKSVHVYSENYSNCHLGNSKSLLKRRKKKCQDPCLNASVHRQAKQSLQHHPLLFSLIPTKPVPFPFSLFQPFPFRNAQEINRFNGISKEL